MKSVVAVTIGLLCLLTPVSIAAAATYDPYSQACQANISGNAENDPGSSVACSDNTGADNISGSGGVIVKVTNIIALVAGIAAIIVIIIGGLNYVSSAGDSAKAASGRSLVLGAVVGLVIILAATGIVRLVLSKL